MDKETIDDIRAMICICFSGIIWGFFACIGWKIAFQIIKNIWG